MNFVINPKALKTLNGSIKNLDAYITDLIKGKPTSYDQAKYLESLRLNLVKVRVLVFGTTGRRQKKSPLEKFLDSLGNDKKKILETYPETEYEVYP